MVAALDPNQDIKDYKKSFYHLAKGNRLTLDEFGYNFEGHFNVASQMMQLFTPEVWVRYLCAWNSI